MDEELLLVVFIGFFRVSAACTCTNSSRGTVCTSSAAGSDSDSYGVDCGGDWGFGKRFQMCSLVRVWELDRNLIVVWSQV